MPAHAGLTLSGYLVTGELGSGAGSYIYKVQDPNNGQTLALKRVIRRSKSDDRFIEQTEIEWQNAQKVNDDRVRKVKAYKKIRHFFSLNEVHLIMEFCAGQCLDKIRPREIPDIMYIFRETALGLAAIHKAGLVHADIKPNNVLIDNCGHLKIIDMGQSCPIGYAKERIQGTPDFIAPEQVHRRPLDERTDIFNLGAAFYWVLTHRNYPTLITPERARLALVSQKLAVPPHEIRPDVHTALSKLVMDCCQESPDDRPSNIGQVLQRLNMTETVMRRHNVNLETSFSRTGRMELTSAGEESGELDLSELEKAAQEEKKKQKEKKQRQILEQQEMDHLR